MSYQSDFEGLEGWDYAVIVACLGGFLILGLLVRLLRSIQPEIKRNTWHTKLQIVSTIVLNTTA